jgi:dinuclear metal center YbgI/SA1388 family protein
MTGTFDRLGDDCAPAVPRQTLMRELDDLLQAGRFEDYCPNGLQVEGREPVRRLATAVTASLVALRAAIAWNADLLLVHHGWFWRGDDPRVTGTRRERLAAVLGAGLNLAAYHLPLDVHPELGNNAQFGQRLGWTTLRRSGRHDLICHAELTEPSDVSCLSVLLAERLERVPLAVGALSRPIRRIAWCTGGAQDLLQEAIDAGADAFVSGEISERTTHLAREAGVVYFAAGHHATERHGVQALGAHLAVRFGFAHRFFDDPNPV